MSRDAAHLHPSLKMTSFESSEYRGAKTKLLFHLHLHNIRDATESQTAATDLRAQETSVRKS